MRQQGHILLADDNEGFSKSTVGLFSKAGFQCQWAPDAPTAAKMLREDQYDVLIADIRMPGNPNLELIREVSQIDSGLPIIVITGYPSVESAVQSVELPVTAYLVKPFEFSELLRHTQSAIKHVWMYRAITGAKSSLAEWSSELDRLEEALPQSSGSAIPVEAFLDLTIRRVFTNLLALRNLNQMIAGGATDSDVCELVNCPRLGEVRKVLEDAVATLEETKAAFKSQKIRQLRERLEAVIENMRN